MTGKYYVWEDIHGKSMMKESHLVKTSGKGTILKMGKIKVAREVSINTDSTKKRNPILAERKPRGLTGLLVEFTPQLCSQEVTREEAALSATKRALFLCQKPHACTPDGLRQSEPTVCMESTFLNI